MREDLRDHSTAWISFCGGFWDGIREELTLFRLVEVVPDFGADEEVLAFNLAVGFGEEITDCVADFFFVVVEPGAIEVAVWEEEELVYGGEDMGGGGGVGEPVSSLQRAFGGFVGFARMPLAGEGAETDRGDGVAAVELEGFAGGHDCGCGGGVS